MIFLNFSYLWRLFFIILMKKLFLFFICCFLALLGQEAWGQDLPFPYDIHVETFAGNCFDDSQAIITLWDATGNEVVIDPSTHHAVDITVHPFFNVEFQYRNQTAGTNTRYDSLNNIQLSAGTYCFGVVGYVPVINNGDTTFELVDTIICNIVVPTHYNHFEASMLSGIAGDNDYYGRERCGIRHAFECADIGRLQLKLRYGKFPYHVQIYDENNQLVRDRYYYQREHNGTDSSFADYMDFYTFDSLAAGDYTLVASDSCGYSIRLTSNVPLQVFRYYTFLHYRQCYNTNMNDSVFAYQFRYYNYWIEDNNHNYDLPYLDTLVKYRFINPGQDTTRWYSISGGAFYRNGWHVSFMDTINNIDRYCDMYGDTITFQLWNSCSGLYTVKYGIHDPSIDDNYYSGNSYQYQEFPEQLETIVTEADTCAVHYLSGVITQRYFISAYSCNGYTSYTYGYEPGTNTTSINSFNFTPPLSLDVYTANDERVLAHDEKSSFNQLSCSFTNPTLTDTSMLVHIVLTDAHGCVLESFYRNYQFTVDTLEGDVPYTWEFEKDNYGCYSDHYILLREKGVDFYRFRKNAVVRLIDSPQYDRYNFTATYHELDDQWDVVMEDTSIHYFHVDFSMSDQEWHFWIHTPNWPYNPSIPTGRYVFTVTSDCGTDTLTYTYSYSDIRERHAFFSVEPQFPGIQVCDRYFVTPYAEVMVNEYRIDVNVSNDEPIETYYYTTPSFSVVSGPTSGWYYSNNQIVFTIPGTYVVMASSRPSCMNETIYHYDTITYEPIYIDFNMGYAVICDAYTSTGNVLTHAFNGTQPYQYYLYDHADLEGTLLGTSLDGNFYDIPLSEGQQVSVLAVDSCQNSFSINMVVTSLSQSALAWESGYAPGNGHCEGDSAFLAALPFTQSVTYHWSGPNNFESDERENTIYLPYGSESGWYTLDITNTGCQTAFTDSVYIEVLHAPTVEILSDTTLCAGSEIELSLVAHGNGNLHYTFHHVGAPQSGELDLTTLAGDTLHQTFPIWGDNIFWVTDAADDRCAYNYIIDTTHVLIYGVEPDATPNIHTYGGTVCYDSDIFLMANSTLTPPYYLNWYSSPTQEELLQSDTILSSTQVSQLSIPNLTHDTVLYISLSNPGRCENLYGAIHHTVNMNGRTLLLQSGEGARFFDSGGEYGNYSNNEQITQTFCCTGQGALRLHFNSLDVIAGDTLFIYAGAIADPSLLVSAITYSTHNPDLVIESNCVTFRFSSNWINVGAGWSIDILTEMVMTEIHGYVHPLILDTLSVEVCQSETPYTLAPFDYLDISTPGHYSYDTILVAANGCDSLLNLNLWVKPVSDTTLYDSTQYALLPFTWNGIVFNDFGTQEATFTNIYNCDSVVHMVLTWTPALELTYDTIVCESDLPFEWYGIPFEESDTVTIGVDTLITLQVEIFRPRLTVCSDVTIRTRDTAELWASGADYYLWTPSMDLSSDHTDTTYAFPERTTTYYVTGTYSGNPCSADTSIVVTVIPRNTVDDYITIPMNLGIDIYPLANDTLSCTDAVPEIVFGPSHGSASVQGTIVNYQPAMGFIGIDSIFYAVNCNDTINRAYIFILMQPYPDNVDSAECVFPPATNVWSIRQSAVSTVSNAVTVSVPMVGDIDDDNEPEILIPQATYGSTFHSIGVYKADGRLEIQFPVATSYIWNSLALGKVQITPNVYQPIMVLFAADRHLYAYDHSGTQLWRSDQPFTSHNNETISLPAVSFADFNHDGWSEVFIGSEIYDAATGTLLCKANGNTGHACRNWDNNIHTYQSMAADLTGDFDLDLAAGNTIYHVILQSRTDFTRNKIEVARQVDSTDMRMADNSAIPFTDGNTFAVDINLDGKLDVVTMNVDQSNHVLYLYVWDANTGEIICSKKIPNSTKFGVPQIGDIDRDGAPELCFIVGTAAGHGTGSNDLIYALKYNGNNSNHEMDVFWTMSHSDNSGSTGLSLFDFNQDGYAELVYRDLYNLRIINGSLVHHQTHAAVSAPYNLATIACCSATGIEYPVIADVDLDGEAEIVVGGASSPTDFGYLYYFKSNGNPWAPARHIWNQYAYNNTNVNDDGSIPLWQFNNATMLPDRYNPSAWSQPFNNFLQQGTSIDRFGKPFTIVPDVAVTGSATINYYPDSVTIDISYCNEGENVLNAPYEITVYENEYRDTVLWVETVSTALPVDSCTHYSFSLPQEVICAHRSLADLVVAVNDGGFGVAQNGEQQGECDTLNNFAAANVIIARDTTYIFDTIVQNQLPYSISGLVFEEAGIDDITLANQHGCDSTVIVDLFVWSNVSTNVDSTICDNALPFTWNGRVFTTAGSDSAVFAAHSDADSIVYMTLYVNPTSHTLITDSVCQGDNYTLYNFNISSSETDTYGNTIHYQHLTNQWQCDSTVELHLFVTPVPQLEFTPEPEKMLLSEGGLIVFHNNTDISTLEGETYHWSWNSGDDNSENSSDYDFEHTYRTWGEFLVTLSLQIYECEASVSHSVYIEADLEFPNVITPNGDGINDVFAIINMDEERPNHLVIFDRWGKKVFDCKNYQTYVRDGVIYNENQGFSADNLSDGVYFYSFHYQGQVRTVDFHGSLTVIR